LKKSKTKKTKNDIIIIGVSMNKKIKTEFLLNSKKILNLFYIVLIFLAMFFIIKILKDIKIFNYIYMFLKLIFPLFLGIFISWLLYPLTLFLQKKGLSKLLSISIVYFFIIIAIIFLISSLFPMLVNQASDFFKLIPNIIDMVLSKILSIVKDESVVSSLKDMVSKYFLEISNVLPSYIFSFFNVFIYRITSILIGIIMGYYLLFEVDSIKKFFSKYTPIKVKTDFIEIVKVANESLLRYFRGALFISFIIFVFSYIILLIIQIPNPLILALICAITNLIPYIGPFIGGGLVTIVGFTQSFELGLLSIVFLVLIQTFDNLILQPLVMSKSMKLKPLSILLGLLIFGNLFGLIGMVFSTPIIFTLINVYKFLDNKYRGKIWKFLKN